MRPSHWSSSFIDFGNFMKSTDTVIILHPPFKPRNHMKNNRKLRLFGGGNGEEPAKDATAATGASDEVDPEVEPTTPKKPKTPSKLPPRLTLPPALPLAMSGLTGSASTTPAADPSPSQTTSLPKNGETMVPIITKNDIKESLAKYQVLLTAAQKYKKTLFDLSKGAEGLAAALEDFSTAKGSQVVDAQSIRAGATTHEIIAKQSLQLATQFSEEYEVKLRTNFKEHSKRIMVEDKEYEKASKQIHAKIKKKETESMKMNKDIGRGIDEFHSDLQALSLLAKDMETLRIEHHRNVRREEGHCMEFVRTKTIEIVNAEAASYDEILKGSASASAKITGAEDKSE